MRKLYFILSLLLVLGLWALPSMAAKKIKPRTVYMFGVSTAFMDSTVLITDIQAVDSVYLTSSGSLLIGRSLYSAQLQQHVEQYVGIPRTTCAVFYNKKLTKLQKEYINLRKKITKDNTMKLLLVGSEVFRFQPEILYDSNSNP